MTGLTPSNHESTQSVWVKVTKPVWFKVKKNVEWRMSNKNINPKFELRHSTFIKRHNPLTKRASRRVESPTLPFDNAQGLEFIDRPLQ